MYDKCSLGQEMDQINFSIKLFKTLIFLGNKYIAYWIKNFDFIFLLVSVPSALSIEERRLLESLDKLNEQLKSKYQLK